MCHWTHQDYPAPYFRRVFLCPKLITNAKLFICGLGYHELYLNGGKVGAQVLAPVVSQYDKRVRYLVHIDPNSVKANFVADVDPIFKLSGLPAMLFGASNATLPKIKAFKPDIRTFLKRWVAEGPTHHFALGVGHRAQTIKKLASILGIEAVIVESETGHVEH